MSGVVVLSSIVILSGVAASQMRSSHEVEGPLRAPVRHLAAFLS